MLTTSERKCGKTFVREMKAIVDVYHFRSTLDEWTEDILDRSVVHEPIVRSKVEGCEKISRGIDDVAPGRGNGASLHELQSVQVVKDHDEDVVG